MLRVGDIMQRDVLVVSPETTVRELTRLLTAKGISGVPVVASSGEVVGVVSSTDVVRLASEEGEVRLSDARWIAGPAHAGREAEGEEESDGGSDALSGYFLPEEEAFVTERWENQWEEAALDEFTVGDIMTPVSFSIGPEATVTELAQFLVRGRIHRAVVSQDDRLVGIVTTMDVLRAVADQRS